LTAVDILITGVAPSFAQDAGAVAVPLWADVSPPVLAHQGGDVFKDSMKATWEFQLGGDGAVDGVTMINADGTTTEMARLGNPRSFD
jgi:hypothetical protein